MPRLASNGRGSAPEGLDGTWQVMTKGLHGMWQNRVLPQDVQLNLAMPRLASTLSMLFSAL